MKCVPYARAKLNHDMSVLGPRRDMAWGGLGFATCVLVDRGIKSAITIVSVSSYQMIVYSSSARVSRRLLGWLHL